MSFVLRLHVNDVTMWLTQGCEAMARKWSWPILYLVDCDMRYPRWGRRVAQPTIQTLVQNLLVRNCIRRNVERYLADYWPNYLFQLSQCTGITVHMILYWFLTSDWLLFLTCRPWTMVGLSNGYRYRQLHADVEIHNSHCHCPVNQNLE